VAATTHTAPGAAVAAAGSAPGRAEDTRRSSVAGDSCSTWDVPMGHQPAGSPAHLQGDGLVRLSPSVWGPGQGHPSSTLLTPARSHSLPSTTDVCSPPEPRCRLRGLSFSSKSPLQFVFHLLCPVFPWRRAAAVSPLCQLLLRRAPGAVRGSEDAAIKGCKQKGKHLFSPTCFQTLHRKSQGTGNKAQAVVRTAAERGFESSRSRGRVGLHLGRRHASVLPAKPFFPKFLLAQEDRTKSELLRQQPGTSIIMWCDNV